MDADKTAEALPKDVTATDRKPVSLLKMGCSIRDAEDSADMLWIMLQMFDWKMLKDRLVKRAMMQQIGMSTPDPFQDMVYVVGVAIGTIETEEPEPEPVGKQTNAT